MNVLHVHGLFGYVEIIRQKFLMVPLIFELDIQVKMLLYLLDATFSCYSSLPELLLFFYLISPVGQLVQLFFLKLSLCQSSNVGFVGCDMLFPAMVEGIHLCNNKVVLL